MYDAFSAKNHGDTATDGLSFRTGSLCAHDIWASIYTAINCFRALLFELELARPQQSAQQSYQELLHCTNLPQRLEDFGLNSSLTSEDASALLENIRALRYQRCAYARNEPVARGTAM